MGELSAAELGKLNNPTDLLTGAEMQGKCVTCYARDKDETHLVRNFKEAMFCGALKTMCEEANICFAHLGYTHPNFAFKGAVVRDDFHVETWGVDTAGNRVSACPLRLSVHV